MPRPDRPRAELRIRSAAALLALCVASEAAAGPSLSVDLSSDQRRRGLSWSAGKPTIEARGAIEPVGDVELSLAATGLRGSARHGGADIGIDGMIGFRPTLGAVRLDALAIHHAFPGHGGANFVEIGTGAGMLIGPAQIELLARYAPRQRAIGGDNLYLGASASVAVIGTPWTIGAHAGRSSGRIRDPLRAARLRPFGHYVDYGLRIDHVIGPVTLGLAYSDTILREHRRAAAPLGSDGGRRVIARLGLTL